MSQLAVTGQDYVTQNCQHNFDPLIEKIKDVATEVGKVARVVFKYTSELVQSSSGMYQLLRVLSWSVVGHQFRMGDPTALSKLGMQFDGAIGILEFVASAADPEALTEFSFSTETLFLLCSRITGAIANVLGVVFFLDQIELLNLGQIAGAVGSVPVLALAVSIPFATVLYGALTIQYVFYILDALVRCVQAKTSEDRSQAALDLINGILEVSLKTFVLVGGTSAPALVTLGVLAAGSGLIAFFYQLAQSNKEGNTNV